MNFQRFYFISILLYEVLCKLLFNHLAYSKLYTYFKALYVFFEFRRNRSSIVFYFDTYKLITHKRLIGITWNLANSILRAVWVYSQRTMWAWNAVSSASVNITVYVVFVYMCNILLYLRWRHKRRFTLTLCVGLHM